MPLAAKDYQRSYQREWAKRNRAKRNAWKKRWLQSPNGKKWVAAYAKKYREEHRHTLRGNEKRDREKLRLDVLAAYGGSPPSCACCGEWRLPFLTLDHSDGNGGTERKTQGHKGGTAQYRRLRMAGFPPGYRVLCWNCNCAIATSGICPHEADKPLKVPSHRVYAVSR